MAGDVGPDFDVFNDLKNTEVESARGAVIQKDYQERIREKDAEGEAGVRHWVRSAQRAVIFFVCAGVCVLLTALTAVGLVLIFRYAAFIWSDVGAIHEMLSKVIEWFLVAFAAMFVKSRLFKD